MKENKNNQKYIPVVSKTGKPLMPCHPARANQLIRRCKAKKQWIGGLFYIKLIKRADGNIQPIACGIDSGSKKEATTIRNNKKTFINIQLDAITHVKDRVESRREMRRARRSRNTPYRKCRYNRARKDGFVAPSIKARYDWKLKIINILNKLFPIKVIVYEDIKTKSLKGKRQWNVSFLPLQTGKNYFIKKLEEISEVMIKYGYDTANKRKELGLKKNRNKKSNSFFAHCVDSWVLAGFGLSKAIDGIDNKTMIFVRKIQFWKRQLHYKKFNKFGKRPRFGGTVSFGMSRGSIVKHKTLGLRRVGGFLTNSRKVGLHELNSYKRDDLNRQCILSNIVHLANYNWTWEYAVN